MPNCAHPNCPKEGEFPAPVNPQNLNLRQYFCAQHIKEFNKKWNGLEGMKAAEINQLQDVGSTWHRPTWPMGSAHASQEKSPENVADLFSLFGRRKPKEPPTQPHAEAEDIDMRDFDLHAPKMPAKVAEAYDLLTLPPQATEAQAKEIYLRLVKKHHPDVREDKDAATDMIQKINAAYKIVKDYFKK